MNNKSTEVEMEGPWVELLLGCSKRRETEAEKVSEKEGFQNDGNMGKDSCCENKNSLHDNFDNNFQDSKGYMIYIHRPPL